MEGRHAARRRESTTLLRAYAETADPAARERLIELHLPLVRALARRYVHRGEHLDDLEQVGTIGLIHAVDRFDPDRGTDLVCFAAPTICGEIKRHLRDRTSAVRIPRRLDEPSRRGAVVPLPRDDEPRSDALAVDDTFDSSDARMLLSAGFRTLDARARRILHLRFFAGLSQAEIARELGLSEILVSRVLRASLERLRGALAERERASRPGRQTVVHSEHGERAVAR
jgi:RNA polymerase sigma-B factor